MVAAAFLQSGAGFGYPGSELAAKIWTLEVAMTDLEALCGAQSRWRHRCGRRIVACGGLHGSHVLSQGFDHGDPGNAERREQGSQDCSQESNREGQCDL